MTQFLSEQQIDEEFRAVQPVEDFQAGSHRFPYLRLSPTGFELLLYALHQRALQGSPPPGYDRVRVLNEGSDRGRDLVLYAAGAPVGVVQCKRHEDRISVPEVLREIIKFILFAKIDPALVPKAEGFLYKLVLSTDPSETVGDLFSEPARVIKAYTPKLASYIDEVIEKFASFKNMTSTEVQPTIEAALAAFCYELVRPADLDALVDASSGVQQRFFGSRLVVDSSMVESRLDIQSAKLDQLLAKTPEPITDADLRSFQKRISEIPESFRFSAGFAKFFGYPAQIFNSPAKLRAFMPRVARFKSEIDAFFIDWLNQEAWRLAEDICYSELVTVAVHPFARQIPAAFLGTVAANAILQSEFGSTMGHIVQTTSRTDETDSQILSRLVGYFKERGVEIQKNDFSKYAEPPEMFETKKSIMLRAIRGLSTEQDVELCLHRAVDVMRNDLDAAAAHLRAMGQRSRTIVLQGLDFLDNSAEVARVADGVRRGDGTKGGSPEQK